MKNLTIYSVLSFFLVFISCEEKEENPKLSTASIKALSAAAYYVKASVSEKGSSNITDYGFEYYYGPNESTQFYNGIKISLGSKLESDTFSTRFEAQNTSYYSGDYKIFVRAYLTNEKGTVYAKPLSADILRLQASSIYPNNGKVGDTIAINGKNFDVVPGNNTVSFGNVNARVISATSTQLKVIVPANINTSYYDNMITIRVQSGNQSVEFNSSFGLNPSPTSFSPNHGSWNTNFTIYGSGLYGCNVYLNDILLNNYNSSNNSISVNIPDNLTYKSFKVYVHKTGQKTEVPGGSFTMDKLQVSSFTPQKCLQGSQLIVYGSNFNPSYTRNKLYIGNQIISSDYGYSSDGARFTIPSTLPKGSYTAYVYNGMDSVKLSGEIEIVTPEITGISPTSGYPNTKFTITGKNFIGYSGIYVYLDNHSFNASITDTSTIKGTIPYVEAGTYSVYATLNNVKIKCPTEFTVLAPTLTSISPATGAAGTSVIINGEGFGNSSNSVYVYFGSMYAYPMSVNNTQINVKVPTGITSGKWVVTVSINGNLLPGSLTFDVP